MNRLRDFDIPFKGLKQGKHEFRFDIDNAFFEAFEYNEFEETSVEVVVELHKKSNLLELYFQSEGFVKVLCDLSSEPYNQSLKGTLELVVKFGETFDDSNDEILILVHGEHKVNIAQYIYEMVVLSVPAKRIHPGIQDGSLDSEILKKLEEMQPKEKSNKEKTDPRWDALKKLLTDK